MTNPPEDPPGPPQPPNGPWGPPPGRQQPGPPPGWQPPPPTQPVWQGHQAPQQSAYGWQAPQPPQKRRTGLVVGLVVGALLLVFGGVAAAAFLLTGDDSDVLEVSQLRAGMCLTSSDLAAGEDKVDDIERTACDGEHDAEVFAVLELEEGESFADAGNRCAGELGDDFQRLGDRGVEVRPLAEGDSPTAGEPVVCFLRNENGDPLTEELV